MKEQNWVWKWETGSRLVASCQKPGAMISAHKLASRQDVFGQTLTRPSRSDPGQFCTVRSMPSLEKLNLKCMWEAGSGIYTIWPDSGCMLHITGHNQNASWSDPACLLGCLLGLGVPWPCQALTVMVRCTPHMKKLHMLSLLPGILLFWFLLSRFIHLHFVPNPLQTEEWHVT